MAKIKTLKDISKPETRPRQIILRKPDIRNALLQEAQRQLIVSNEIMKRAKTEVEKPKKEFRP